MISFLLAFALLLIGLAPQEQVVRLAASNVEPAQAQEGGQSPRLHEGSPDDHPGDAPTAQWEVQGETSTDLVGLLAHRHAALPALPMGWPRPQVATRWLAPDLDGPQRPPRAIRSIA